jgi:hypothetical protein
MRRDGRDRVGIRRWPRGQHAGPGVSSVRLPPQLLSRVFLSCWDVGSAWPGDPRSGYLIYDDSRHPCDMDTDGGPDGTGKTRDTGEPSLLDIPDADRCFALCAKLRCGGLPCCNRQAKVVFVL